MSIIVEENDNDRWATLRVNREQLVYLVLLLERQMAASYSYSDMAIDLTHRLKTLEGSISALYNDEKMNGVEHLYGFLVEVLEEADDNNLWRTFSGKEKGPAPIRD